jgi:hypothetical protein
MNEIIQQVLTIALLAAAITYSIVKSYRTLFPKKTEQISGCGSGCGCGNSDLKKEMVIARMKKGL